ncbi:MAG: enolase C-terminal domain-like protein [Pseudomonadota bacterium]
MVDRIERVRVTEAAVTAKTTWRFVEISSAAGRVGAGEFTFEPAPAEAADQMRALATSLIGSPATRSSLHGLGAMLQAGFASATFYSALEQALTDLDAQAAGTSIAGLCGAVGQGPVPLYANINRRTTVRTPESFAQSARLAVAAGFGRVKLAPFDGLSPERCGTGEGAARIAEGLARITAVADAVPNAAVMVDCHWRFTEEAAHQVLPALFEARVAWFECPLPETLAAVPALSRLRRAANERGMRLAGLETMVGWAGFAPFVEGEAYDVIMPDIKHCGGHGALIEIAERAGAHGVVTSAHNPSGPVAHAHSLHATACLSGGEPLEVQFDETPLFDQLTTPAPPPRAGESPLPEGFGLGLSLKAGEDA